MKTSTKPKIVKEGRARVIQDDKGKIICEEVVCLGHCNGTFFRRGKDIGKHSVRKCGKCQSRGKKQSGWAAVWGGSVFITKD